MLITVFKTFFFLFTIRSCLLSFLMFMILYTKLFELHFLRVGLKGFFHATKAYCHISRICGTILFFLLLFFLLLLLKLKKKKKWYYS